MSEILKEYIRGYLVNLSEDKAKKRKAKSSDAELVVDKLNDYFEAQDLVLEIVGMASQGSQSSDLKIKIFPLHDGRPVFVSDEQSKPWIFEIKSFGADTDFTIEMTNPESFVRKAVLKRGSTVGSKQEVEDQLRDKISTNPRAVRWAEAALQSPFASVWKGSVIIRGDDEPRILKVVSGDVGDWSRLQAAGGSGKFRSFYTVSNPILKTAEKKMYYTDKLEEAIQSEFVKKGDDVLILRGESGRIRCFSLSPRAISYFDEFPEFYSGGNTIVPESAKVTSFGGGGRIGIKVKVEESSGFVIP